MLDGEKRLEQIRTLLAAKRESEVIDIFLALQPYDQAEVISLLTPEERRQFMPLLDDESLAPIFKELESDVITEVVDGIGGEWASRVLGEMSSDDAADLLGELEGEQVEELLDMMETEDAEEITALLTHPEETAGGRMTKEYVTVKRDWSVGKTLKILREIAPGAETIYYLYVTDDQERLVGVVSLRQLIVAAPETPVGDVMSKNVISVSVTEDQEMVARQIKKYDFLALPVIDHTRRIVGIVTVDDVMDVLEDEATEDISRLAAIQGVSSASDLWEPAHQAAMKRLPWLVLLLGIGLVSGNIIARFEETLETVLVLALFIPLITDMAGNTGTQALAVVVWGLAIGEFRPRDLLWLMKREAGVGLIVGIVNGLLIAVGAYIWQGNIWLGFVIGFSLWITLFVATMAGTVVPLILFHFNIDPAVASGPLITTINDIIGLTIYFSVATAFMNLLLH
ncbi:MAG: magnesium transporter [Firmicutes bacterium]|nr:magnesium transporter [Bacillota bacterium]